MAKELPAPLRVLFATLRGLQVGLSSGARTDYHGRTGLPPANRSMSALVGGGREKENDSPTPGDPTRVGTRDVVA